MYTVVCNQFKYKIATGDISLSGDDFAVSLVDSGITAISANIQDGNNWSEFSEHEISGTGYTIGGKVIANISVTKDDDNNVAKWDGDNVEWTSATFVTYGAFIRHVDTDTLVGYVDFGSNQTVESGSFTITWNSSGILTLS